MKAVWEFDWEEIEEIRKTNPDKADFIEYAQWQDEEGGWMKLIQRNGASTFPPQLRMHAEDAEAFMQAFRAKVESLAETYEVQL